MTKLGATILGIIVLAVIGFASMLSFGDGRIAIGRPAPTAADTVGNATMVVPVRGIPANGIVSTWGQERDGGARGHTGTDIAAPAGAPVVAAAAGTVDKLFKSAAGGTTLYVRSPDRRLSYYYAHLQRYADGVREGMRVKPGDTIGYVGDTGNAGAGNFHLHFGISRMGPRDSWSGGVPLDPAPILARAGTAR